MGALSHITSFWRFRFPDRTRCNIDAQELVMMLQDFSKGFAVHEAQPAAPADRPRIAALHAQLDGREAIALAAR